MLRNRDNRGSRQRATVLAALLCGLSGVARSVQAQDTAGRIDALQQLNGSVESLVRRVSQSVVQILVTSYGPVDENVHTDTDLVVARQRILGSGVVVDSDGYVVTNAHVVGNARRIEVVLPGPGSDQGGVRSLVKGRGRIVDARIVGIAREIDLALLKVQDSHLPAIPLADYDALRQGEVVFAFGSPEGLRNSVTMGIVSAVARQPDPDNPMVYVQTDAPINRGNSGGPLVNVRGELVGINTFILTDAGRSQGLGFAIPSALVRVAYPRLRRYGRLHRGEIGIQLQTITPALARGLGLSQDWGVIIADVTPASPSEVAGLRAQDIVVSIDGEAVDSLPQLAFQLFTRSAGDRVKLGVARGSDTFTVDVPVEERSHDLDRLADLVELDKSFVARLGIFGIDIDDTTAQFASGLRVSSGVIVVGHLKDGEDLDDAGLMTGDAIHGINGTPVTSVEALRTALDALKSRSSVALQVERNGQFIFLAFDLD